MDPAPREAILEDLLGALERGDELDLERLKRRYPSDEREVERLYRAAAGYRSVASTLFASRREAEKLAPGDRLGDFEIVGELSRGGMAIVYRARQLSLDGRAVALKVLPAELQGEEAKRRFRREALSLAALHHPSLSEVYGFGEQRGLLFYAMRLIEGPTLSEVIERARAEPAADPAARESMRRTFVRWIAQVASALAEVHAAGLVHRDVKLANILIAGDPTPPFARGDAVLVDFGLVRPADSGVTLSGLSATPSYAPPEQLLGLALDARADVFSLGATLHDLASLRLPAERPQASAGLGRLRALDPSIDADLDAIVAKSLEAEPRWRYPDASALLVDLESWLHGRAVSARRPSATERAQRWVRAHPSKLALALLALLFLVGALAWAGAESWQAAASGRRARDAWQRADVAALVESLGEIPRALAWPALRESELVDLARRARNPDASDPLLRVALELRAGDSETALFDAATNMRLRGLASEPVIADLFLACLRGSAPAPTAEIAAAERRIAFLLAARLFYERPDESPAQARESEAFRAALLDAFARADLSAEARDSALTALSGCARAEDAPALLAWALAQTPRSESQRLAFECTERIVRRAHDTGGLERIDWDALWRSLAPYLREHYRWPDALPSEAPWGVRVAPDRLARALLFAERSVSSATPAMERLLPPSALELAHAGPPRTTYALFAAAGDRRVADALANGTAVDVGPEARTWGWMCGAFGDDELSNAARNACVERAGERRELVQEFDDGVSEGSGDRRGRLLAIELDADTLLGAPLADLEFHALEASSLGAADGARGEVAVWDFRTSPAVLRGTARGVEIRLAAPAPDGSPEYLRFGAFGSSEVRLELDVEADPGPTSWTLRLEHVSASRRYYALQGEVYVSASLDDKPLAVAQRVSSQSEGVLDLELPVERLAPGRHELSIGVHRDSTTTYRLGRVQVLREGPDRWKAR